VLPAQEIAGTVHAVRIVAVRQHVAAPPRPGGHWELFNDHDMAHIRK